MSEAPNLRLVPSPASGPASPAADPAPSAADAPRAPARRKRRSKPKRVERGQSKHPGVVVIRPRPGRPNYALRYTEPETGLARQPKLPGVTTIAEAEAAAFELHRNLQQRSLQVTLVGGREFASSAASVRQEIDLYLSSVRRKVSRHGRSTSPHTLDNYRIALEQFAGWCEKRGCAQVSKLTRNLLAEWCESRFTRVVRGGKTRMASTVNQDLKPVRQMLVAAALAGRLAHLTSDAIRGALKSATEPAPKPRCYSVPEIRAALRATLEYDESDFRAGLAQFAPVVAVGLLAGMRRSELAELQVRDVLFDAPSDYDPSITTGLDLIRLPGSKTKTGAPRDVLTTAFSPLLGELLRALTRGRAGHERVFRFTEEELGSRAEKLRAGGRKPPKGFCLKDLRSTCATYQCPLAGSIKAKADRLGHTIGIAERHYLALPSGTPVSAPDLETVMQCKAELRQVIAQVQAQGGKVAGTKDKAAAQAQARRKAAATKRAAQGKAQVRK